MPILSITTLKAMRSLLSSTQPSFIQISGHLRNFPNLKQLLWDLGNSSSRSYFLLQFSMNMEGFIFNDRLVSWWLENVISMSHPSWGTILPQGWRISSQIRDAVRPDCSTTSEGASRRWRRCSRPNPPTRIWSSLIGVDGTTTTALSQGWLRPYI